MALIPLCREAWQFRMGKHAYQPIHGIKPFQWLPYLDIEVQVQGPSAEVCTVILPVESLEEV